MTPISKPSKLIYDAEEVLENQGVSFHGEIPDLSPYITDFEGSLAALIPPLRTDFEISVGSQEFLLLGGVQGKFKVQCSRCLIEIAVSFNQELEAVFPRSNKEINVEEEVRQALVLSLPSKPVCRPECQGLCPVCGVNKNEKNCQCEVPSVNPFAKLKEFYKEGDK